MWSFFVIVVCKAKADHKSKFLQLQHISVKDFQTPLKSRLDWIFNLTFKCTLRFWLQLEDFLGILRHANIKLPFKSVSSSWQITQLVLEQVLSQRTVSSLTTTTTTFLPPQWRSDPNSSATQTPEEDLCFNHPCAHLFCTNIVFQMSLATFSYQACEYLMNKHLLILIRSDPWHASFLYVLVGGGGGGKWWHTQYVIVSVSS